MASRRRRIPWLLAGAVALAGGSGAIGEEPRTGQLIAQSDELIKKASFNQTRPKRGFVL